MIFSTYYWTNGGGGGGGGTDDINRGAHPSEILQNCGYGPVFFIFD